jgi:signal transduction histidine kinase
MPEKTRRPTREVPAGGLVTGLTGKLAELEDAVRRQGDRFGGVLEIGAALSSTRDIDQLLRLVVDRVSGLLGAEAATLFTLDRESKELVSRVMRGPALKELRVPSSLGVVGYVVRTGQTVLLDDAYQDSRFNPEVDRHSGFKTRSLIAVPLKNAAGSIVGAMEVLHRRPGAFAHDDIALVEAIAAQVAAVLENVLLYDQLRRQNEELRKTQQDLSQALDDVRVLYEIEKALSSADREADLLDRVLEKAIAVCGAGAGSVLLANEDQGLLYFRSARGERSEQLLTLSLKADQGIAGHVARTGEVVRADDVESVPYYDRSIAKRLGVTLKSVLCVPIPGDGGTLGALELLNRRGGFGEAEERLATLLAGQTGRAIQVRSAREEGLRQARLATIGQMLSGVLHDLRTPMTVISGYTQLIAMEPDPAERRKYSDIVERQFEHINAMTRETLAFARGEREILLRKVSIGALAQEVGEHLKAELERSGVELSLEARYEGAARIDENKIKRAIYNITRNARQAMPDGGRFAVTFEREKDELVLRFADTGPGIPEEIADRLFQSFVTAGKKDGTGLGLAIVKRIAEEHGGTVFFKSKPGKGTTFEIRLPIGL